MAFARQFPFILYISIWEWVHASIYKKDSIQYFVLRYMFVYIIRKTSSTSFSSLNCIPKQNGTCIYRNVVSVAIKMHSAMQQKQDCPRGCPWTCAAPAALNLHATRHPVRACRSLRADMKVGIYCINHCIDVVSQVSMGLIFNGRFDRLLPYFWEIWKIFFGM